MGNKNSAGLNTIVGKGSVLEGHFEIQDGIRVDGMLKGRLHSSGMLVVGTSGVVEADPVQVRDAVIAGRVVGKLEASHRVKLEASAVFVGDIAAALLVVEEGAVFRGFCEAGETDLGVPDRPGRPQPVEGVDMPAAPDGKPDIEIKKAAG